MKLLGTLSAVLLLSFPGFAADAPKKTPIVFTKVAEKTEVSDQLTYPARVESKINARVVADADGVVLKILAPLGSKVARGGGLAVIKNMEPGYSYAPMRLVSAVSGIVSHVKVTVGSQVTRGQEIVVVTDPGQLKILVEISAPDIGLLPAGTKGEFRASGTEAPIPVKVAGVSPLVDPATGTATAELVMDGGKAQATLAPGVIGQVHFKVNSRKGIVLADHAVLYKGNETFARLVVDGKQKSAAIKLGPKRRGMIEVLEGLKPGDVYIERASGYIADGDTVQVQEPEKKTEVN